jgi:hypothetical protein
MNYFNLTIRKLNIIVRIFCVHSVYFCIKYFTQHGNKKNYYYRGQREGWFQGIRRPL